MGRSVIGFILLILVLPVPMALAAEGPAGRWLVSFDAVPPAVGDVLRGVRVLESFPFARVALLEGPERAIAGLPGVAFIAPEERITLTMERERGIVDAEPLPNAAWPTGSGVTVALVDSGIDATHPAFDGRVPASVRISKGGVVSGEPGDADGHGTHVAGIIAGDGAGSVGERHRGIAPGADLVAIDISDSFTTTNAVRAFAWIHDNAGRYNIRVVSNSWGREKEGAEYAADDPVIRASDALAADGIVVVFSAGNRGRDGSATLTPEAMNPNVITVGAASASGRVEGYSSRGPAIDESGRRLAWTKPDIMAPGSAVISTRASAFAPLDPKSDEERYYTVMNGTSMAAPQVAAAAALLLSQQPELTPGDVMLFLQRNAADLGTPGADDETGYGMLDVGAALRDAALASSGERRIVVEKRVPVKADGTLAAALGQVLLTNNAPRLPPGTNVAIPLALPEGAAAVDVWFNWSGEGDFEARLVGPAGAMSFERMGGNSLHLAASVSSGAYRVEAIPTGSASRASWTLGGSIVVREEQLISVATESTGRPLRASGTFAPAPTSSGILELDPLMQAPLLVIAVLATGSATWIVGRKRR